MACTSYGSSSGVAMYFRIGTNHSNSLIDSDILWDEVPFTSESLAGNLTSSLSERIMAARAYAGSAVTSGEVSGSISFEIEVSPFFDFILQAALQSEEPLYTITDKATLTIAAATPTKVESIGKFAGVLGSAELEFAAGTDMPELGGAIIPTTKAKCYVFYLVSSGTIGVARGPLFDVGGTVVIPDPPVRSLPIGHVIVSNSSGSGFVPGTTELSEVGISTTFTNYNTSVGTIKNGSTPLCFDFLKRVKRGSGYDYFVFRGVQIDGVSINISPGSLITGEIQLQGIRTGAGDLGATDGSNDVLTSLPSGWTLREYESESILSSVFSIQNLVVLDSNDADVGVISRELSLSLSNQLRQQQAIGTGTPYAAGVASGRFMVTASLEAYYSGPTIIDAMTNDQELQVKFDLTNEAGYGWTFYLPKCKVTSAPPPLAEGADQDLMISTEVQGFEDSVNGSVKITKIVA